MHEAFLVISLVRLARLVFPILVVVAWHKKQPVPFGKARKTMWAPQLAGLEPMAALLGEESSGSWPWSQLLALGGRWASPGAVGQGGHSI